MSNKTIELLERINTRFDDVEKLLQILLVNNLIEETEQIINLSDIESSSALQHYMNRFGVVYGGVGTVNDVNVVITEIPEGTKLKVNDYSLLCLEMKKCYPDKEPLLMFKIINGMQRKRLLQEGISFGVKGKELHVSNRGKQR